MNSGYLNLDRVPRIFCMEHTSEENKQKRNTHGMQKQSIRKGTKSRNVYIYLYPIYVVFLCFTLTTTL